MHAIMQAIMHAIMQACMHIIHHNHHHDHHHHHHKLGTSKCKFLISELTQVRRMPGRIIGEPLARIKSGYQQPWRMLGPDLQD